MLLIRYIFKLYYKNLSNIINIKIKYSSNINFKNLLNFERKKLKIKNYF